MFDLIENWKRPQIQWWTLPAIAFMILCLGINIGLLIGRRNWDASQWIQIAFVALVAGRLAYPILHEIQTLTSVDKNGK